MYSKCVSDKIREKIYKKRINMFTDEMSPDVAGLSMNTEYGLEALTE